MLLVIICCSFLVTPGNPIKAKHAEYSSIDEYYYAERETSPLLIFPPALRP